MTEETNNPYKLNTLYDSDTNQQRLKDIASPYENAQVQQKAFKDLAEQVKILNLLFYSLLR
jgi:hypothetical protein